MNCPNCRQPLMFCNCHDAAEQIERFLVSAKIAYSLHNDLVHRAAQLIEKRIVANEMEFFKRHPDLKRFPPRRRFVLPKKAGKK
jgi:hypothetical protein